MSERKQKAMAFAGAFAGVVVIAAIASDARHGVEPEAVTLASAPVAGGTLASVSDDALDALLAREKAVSLISLTETPWQLACVSRNAQPVPPQMQALAAGCWPDAGLTGLGGSFLSVVDEAGGCHHWRSTRPVIDKGFDDALCIARDEVPTLSISLKGEVLDIE